MGGYSIVGLLLNEGEACGTRFTLFNDCAGGYLIVGLFLNEGEKVRGTFARPYENFVNIVLQIP